MILLKVPGYISPLISLCAFILALISLLYTLRNAKKSMRLSIQQAVIKTAIEKAKDCNIIWDKSNITEHYDVISEMVISKEIILKSFEVYQKLEKGVIKEKEDYAYIFWKQLKTDVRGFFTSEAVKIALRANCKTTYGDQLLSINDFIKNHNENQSTQYLFESLRELSDNAS